MSYQATIVKIKTLPHPNADKLQLGVCMGTTVVIGKDIQDGQLMVYFPTDGRLSEEFAVANDLVGYKDPKTGERKGGFFGANRKIRAQKFRGQKSDGFACELEKLSFAGDISDLKEGDSFDVFNGVKICEKYYTPETIKQMNSKQGNQRRMFSTFPKHVETEQFYKECDYIPVNSTIWLTEKLHGTSFRVGNVYIDEALHRKWYHKLLGLHPKFQGFDIVNGTRNTVLTKTDKVFYQNESFRDLVIQNWAPRLHKGEIVYGEIVGYTTTKQPIMNPASLKDMEDKELRKKYGDLMHYSYGCNPEPDYLVTDMGPLEPQQDIYVYRIVRTDELGNTVEYSWPQVKARCQELGIKTVPEISPMPFSHYWKNNGHLDMTIEQMEQFVKGCLKIQVEENLEGSSLLDSTHMREGIVLRIEPPIGKPYWLKAKSFSFKCAEGMIKEQDTYVDLEEIS